MNKRKLYESIMSSVAKQIKNTLNENTFNDEEVIQMIKAASAMLPSTFAINIGIDNIQENFIFDALKYCVDPIIENIVAAGFAKQYTDNNYYKHFNPKETDEDGINHGTDFVIESPSGTRAYVEVKAYTSSLANLKPTNNQWKADYILCVKYELSKNIVTILSLDCITPSGNTEHVKVTRDMINNGISGDYGKEDVPTYNTGKQILRDVRLLLSGQINQLSANKYMPFGKEQNLVELINMINRGEVDYGVNNDKLINIVRLLAKKNLTKEDIKNIL